MIIKPIKKVNAEIEVPGDKSISHRAVMIGSIAKGATSIENFLSGEDCISTVDCFRKLGVEIEVSGTSVRVLGRGLRGLIKPSSVLDAGNSGTTARLMMGILAGQEFSSEITGDRSLCSRPMGRVITPLKLMGASIYGKNQENFAPVIIEGRKLKGINYEMPVASAQVKSSILLASLYADGETKVYEKFSTRDHTEKMLGAFGAKISMADNVISIAPPGELFSGDIYVPSDISSAAFFIVLALILNFSCVTIKNTGINPTRAGIIEALKKMNADITFSNERVINGERIADITARSGKLTATAIEGALIPRMIDEIPVFAVAACFAEGTTVIKNAEELKVKESNRIKTVTEELKKMGADIYETDDGMIIRGTGSLKGAPLDSHGDHRVAMSMAVAALAAKGESSISGAGCADISFPGFFNLLERF